MVEGGHTRLIRALIGTTGGTAALLVLLLGVGSYLVYREPPLWVALLALSVLVFAPIRLPIPLLAFWLYGILTLPISLGPGNTLVAFIWESAQIVAFIAGVWPLAVGVSATYVVASGFLDVISLAMFDLQQYMSGSVNYVVGAFGAAIVVPLLHLATLRRSFWPIKVWSIVVCVLCLSAALSSGSRAVYLALGVAIAIAGGHLLKRRLRHTAVRWAILALVVGGSTAVLEVAAGGRLIVHAWQAKGTLEDSISAVESRGVLAQRLRLWRQGLDAALEFPLGTGTGTYRATTHAFQQYPMLWSSSPHNYAIEVLVTRGWPRLVLLGWLVIVALLRGLANGRWPWAVAAIALGITTLLDVTGGYPGVIAMMFMFLGASYFGNGSFLARGKDLPTASAATVGRGLRIAGCIALAVVTFWWFMPCNSRLCAVDRYLGIDQRALSAIAVATPYEQTVIFDRLRSLYPQSLWVLQAELAYASSEESRHEISREIATRFPYQHPDNYLRWAEAALALGDEREARRAVLAGLDVFSPETYPYGENRMSPETYAAWLLQASRILETTGD